jgi:hypothetical protein
LEVDRQKAPGYLRPQVNDSSGDISFTYQWRGSDFSADLFRIAGTYLKLREKIPLEIVEQLR